VPPPASQESRSKSSLLLALVCASIVADYDRSWLARPVAQLIPDGGPRPEWISRIKAKLGGAFADLVEAASRRGRRPNPPRDHRDETRPELVLDETRYETRPELVLRAQ